MYVCIYMYIRIIYSYLLNIYTCVRTHAHTQVHARAHQTSFCKLLNRVLTGILSLFV